MAAAFSKALGQTVRYNEVPPEVYRSFGFPGADDLGNMFQFNRDFADMFCAARNLDVLARRSTRGSRPSARGSAKTRDASRSSSGTLWREDARPCSDPSLPPPSSPGRRHPPSSSWVIQTSPTTERLRGVSAASDTVAWASGNKGTVVRTVDGGATWSRVTVPAAEALDFRDIEAFGADIAYVLAIGPGDKSRIYKTEDGGKALGAAVHEPRFSRVLRRHRLLGREDRDRRRRPGGWPVHASSAPSTAAARGRRCRPANIPEALPGDGAFAASGTCLVVQGSRHAWFGSGGAARARVYRSADQGLTWAVADTPIMAGNASSGVFSLAFSDAEHGIAVGGDYRLERESGDNLALTSDGGRTWAFAGSGEIAELPVRCRVRARLEGQAAHRRGPRRHGHLGRRRRHVGASRRRWVPRAEHRARRRRRVGGRGAGTDWNHPPVRCPDGRKGGEVR